MIDLKHLDDFMHRFFGYGSWDAPLWFVGMEEGGGGSLDELSRRLNAWDGTDDLADLRDFHRAIHVGGKDWFRERPPIQSTWGKLIRTILESEGLPANSDAVRRYQRDLLGRRDASHALIELLPLPSASTAHWIYADLNVPKLRSRDAYEDALLEQRISDLRTRIRQHKPKHIVFYGIGYLEHWRKIAAIDFRPVTGERFLIADESTRFLVAPHPAAPGVRNRDYQAIGSLLGSFAA